MRFEYYIVIINILLCIGWLVLIHIMKVDKDK